jgi:hypothetical protein
MTFNLFIFSLSINIVTVYKLLNISAVNSLLESKQVNALRGDNPLKSNFVYTRLFSLQVCSDYSAMQVFQL